MKKNVTISQVAEKVGVSKTTISRFLNGHYGNMSKETKERIAQTIVDLKYRPNRQAQALKSKRSYLIGIVVADISNMYSSLLLKGIGEVLGKVEYQMVIVDAANSVSQERELLEKLIDQGVEGIILQASSRDASHYDFLDDANIPLLLVDRQTEPLKWPLITSDNVEATQKLMEVVLDKGYEKIVVVSEPLADIVTRQLRYQTVKELTDAANRELVLIETNFEASLKLEILTLVKDPKKTVLFASNGRVIMQLLTILINEKIKIPDEIGITGFDDWNLTALVGPGITSIEQQTRLIGEAAGEQMMKLINHKETPIERHIVPAKLQWRNSI